MNPSAPDTVDPLRLSHCIACGYTLQGLSDVGICPECGQAYDRETVVLHGWARGTHATVANASPGVLWWVLLLQLFWPFYLYLHLRSVAESWWQFPLILVSLGFTAMLLWKRWSNDMPALIQVHLSGRGVLQLDDPRALSRGEPTPWGKVNHLLLKPVDAGRWRLTIARCVPWWRPAPQPYADAIVQCSEEQAIALRQRTDQWRSEAAANARTGGFPVVVKQ